MDVVRGAWWLKVVDLTCQKPHMHKTSCSHKKSLWKEKSLQNTRNTRTKRSKRMQEKKGNQQTAATLECSTRCSRKSVRTSNVQCILKMASSLLHTKPWANRQPTNHARGHVPCKVYRGPMSVLLCVSFLFPEEAGLRECLSQDRRSRARTLPTQLPGIKDTTLTSPALHLTCGTPR